MKVSYNKISSGHTYPLSRTEVVKLRCVVGSSLLAAVSAIRSGCNAKTTQEGRTVQRGKQYEIRINFCFKNNQSRLLSSDKDYLRAIQGFGGQIDQITSLITWSPHNAQLYAFYLLLHEVAHVAYCERFSQGKLVGHGSPTEEAWCDEYVAGLLGQLQEQL